MKKLRTLLNEIGYIGLVSKTGFVGNPPATMKTPKTSIKEEEEDWYSDDPDAPEPFYGDDPEFSRGADPNIETKEHIQGVYDEALSTLSDINNQILTLEDQVGENLDNAFEDTSDPIYEQESNQMTKYYNNIKRNIELTQKHLKSFN